MSCKIISSVNSQLASAAAERSNTRSDSAAEHSDAHAAELLQHHYMQA